jgi:transposase
MRIDFVLMSRKVYPSDVTDEEWEFVLPYLSLMTQDAPQRSHDLREVFNALRWLVRSGAPWRYLPGDFPRWEVVYQQTQRWINAQVFEQIAHDLRALLRQTQGKHAQPSTAIFAFLTRALYKARPKVAIVRAATVTRSSAAPRFMRQLTHWGICWRCA